MLVTTVTVVSHVCEALIILKFRAWATADRLHMAVSAEAVTACCFRASPTGTRRSYIHLDTTPISHFLRCLGWAGGGVI